MLVLPGSGSPAKNWPAENFIALAKTLVSRITSLVILGPAEAALDGVFAGSGWPTVSEIGLNEVAALARLSRVFVGNDSGVSHLAAAAGASGLSDLRADRPGALASARPYDDHQARTAERPPARRSGRRNERSTSAARAANKVHGSGRAMRNG